MAEGKTAPRQLEDGEHLSRDVRPDQKDKVSTSSSGPGESTSVEENSYERFYHWLSCICVVTFDLELGQALEVGCRVLHNHQHTLKLV